MADNNIIPSPTLQERKMAKKAYNSMTYKEAVKSYIEGLKRGCGNDEKCVESWMKKKVRERIFSTTETLEGKIKKIAKIIVIHDYLFVYLKTKEARNEFLDQVSLPDLELLALAENYDIPKELKGQKKREFIIKKIMEARKRNWAVIWTLRGISVVGIIGILVFLIEEWEKQHRKRVANEMPELKRRF